MRERIHLPASTRLALIGATALSGLAWGWAALALPWRAGAPLGLLGWGLAVLHVASALVLSWRPSRSGRALALLALGSLAAAPLFSLAVVVTSVQMVRMFGPLGWGLAVALGAIGWLLLLGTVPIGLFLLHLTRSA